MSKIWLEASYPHAQRLVGIDEAGRGPLAGPCVVAGVILPKDYLNPLIDDSKRLTDKKRQEAFSMILADAVWMMVVTVLPAHIDRDNIYRATKHAMRQIAMSAQADLVLTDAMPLVLKDTPVYDFVKGDQKSISIAAASIVAKVIRDDIMMMYDRIYPAYNFKQHKGYPTQAHIQALKEFGITEIHRKSFSPVSSYSQISLFK